jgi:RNA polymerase II subunit A small phosphatase-like protein
MGRELRNTIIIDNSPASYLFHPENAVPIESWFDDPSDRDLLELIPFLQECANASDVRVPLRERYYVA